MTMGGINYKQKKGLAKTCKSLFLAEREGFEPPVPLSTTVFKTAAIDHSAISPKLLSEVLSFKSDAKVRLFFESASVSEVFFRFRVIFCGEVNFLGSNPFLQEKLIL